MHQRAITFWGKQSPRKGPAAEDDTAASLTNGPPQTDTLCDSKPPCLINGFISHGCKNSSTNTSPLKVKRKTQRFYVAGEGRNPDGVSANGTTEEEKMLPHPNVPSARMKQRMAKRWKEKMWEAHKASLESPTPVQEEENWESELQDVTVPDWKKLHFGDEPYGPEDLLHFSMRGLKLNPQDLIFQRLDYWPAKHHPDPIQWHHYSRGREPGQFADAQEDLARATDGCLTNQGLVDGLQDKKCNGQVIESLQVLVTSFTSIQWRAELLFRLLQWGQPGSDVVSAPLQAPSMVSPTIKAVVDAVWALWSIGASVYDFFHTKAMEERIHTLENVITIHQCVIGLLSAGVFVLFTYIFFKKV